jgi:adenine-specific DNA-methyltransferase
MIHIKDRVQSIESPMRGRTASARSINRRHTSGQILSPHILASRARAHVSKGQSAELEAAVKENSRRLGQVPTPLDVARFMAHCLDAQSLSTILDPGAGAAALSLAVLEVTREVPPQSLTLVEIDPAAASRLQSDPRISGAQVVISDFIPWAIQQVRAGRSWDRIIANPPYLNFHDFDRDTLGAVNVLLGTKLNKLSNLFAGFILLSARLLAPGGRMVFITPTELFTTNYGRRTLGSLAKGVRLSRVIVFDSETEPFSDADTSACVSVFEREEREKDTAVEVQRVTERNGDTGLWQVSAPRKISQTRLLAHPKEVIWSEDHLGKIPPSLLTRLGDLVRVSRGIATGANSFFVLDSATREEVDPGGKYTVPVIFKSQDLGQSLVFDTASFRALNREGNRCWLLYLSAHDRLPVSVAAYIAEGEKQGVAARYLCKVRTPWWVTETQKTPLAFVPVFTRTGIRFILNRASARTLTCCHRVYARPGQNVSEDTLLLLACYMKSAEGRNAAAREYRHYGSGLLKLEPRDLENVLVPDFRLLTPEERAHLASRAKEIAGRRGDISSACDAIVEQMLDLFAGHGGGSRPKQAALTRWSDA